MCPHRFLADVRDAANDRKIMLNMSMHPTAGSPVRSIARELSRLEAAEPGVFETCRLQRPTRMAGRTETSPNTCMERYGAVKTWANAQAVSSVSGLGFLPSISDTPNSAATAAATNTLPVRSISAGSWVNAATTRPINCGLSLFDKSSPNHPRQPASRPQS